MKKTFFSHDKNFYAALFPLLIIISLQNLISYSVNMADNIMLGAYSQNALSGAALVNQVFFLIQQAAVVIGDGLVVNASQYWGRARTLILFAYHSGTLFLSTHRNRWQSWTDSRCIRHRSKLLPNRALH